MKKALLLIAHGSRQPAANADLFSLAEDLRRRGDYDLVEPSFLDLAEPTIDVAAGNCVALGAERVIMAPYFLSAGAHVRRDLEDHRRRLAESFPDVQFLLAAPLGPHPLLLEILSQRVREADQSPPS